MKRIFLRLQFLAAVLLLTGCLGNGGTPAPMPTNVTVVAGDSSAVVSWNMLPGYSYWVYKAAGDGVTLQNCITMSECGTTIDAVSPAVIGGLTNGTNYSFSINGRSGGASGGPASDPISVVPRLAGVTWSSGTPLGTADLRGAAYGAVTSSLTNMYVAVGAGAALYSSADGKSWSLSGSPAPAADMNAVAYSAGRFVAVGSGGVILQSTDALNWAQQNSPTANDLYGVTGNGIGGFVAVGVGGVIVASSDGLSWYAASSGTTSDLHGVTYGLGRYVVAGNGGMILSSTDAVNWQQAVALTAQDLHGAVYGTNANLVPVPANPYYTFVVVGSGGVVETSPDGVNWTLQAALPSLALNAVAHGHQFIAVDNNGNIFTSQDGVTWQAEAFVTATQINAIASGLYTYVAVGASGLNLYSM